MRLIGYSRFDSWADNEGQNEGDIDFNLSTGKFIIIEDEKATEKLYKMPKPLPSWSHNFSIDSEKMNELVESISEAKNTVTNPFTTKK